MMKKHIVITNGFISGGIGALISWEKNEKIL